MSVGFGFSVGDFIAALELVATVVDALRESSEASNRYRALVRQLDSLETVLLRVKRLELDESQQAEHVALQQAASQCQRTIDEFWKKIKKYQPALGMKGTTSRLKEGWMKIRWAMCKKEDINSFQNDVASHTDSIQLLLTTVQMSRTNLLENKACRRNLSLAGKIQVAYFECMKKISAVFEATSTGIQQGKELIATSSKILQTNVQIFQVVLNIQNFITRIPAQVERQQPVYLIDALGRHSPFHLEFIRSAEALTAVLQANFSKSGQARKKIERGEFVIQNSLTKRDINIHDDWQNCFHPGQRVEMSVIFQRRWQAGSSCPGCGMICDGSTEADVNCPNCDMTFRRIIKIEDEEPSKTYSKVVHQQAEAIEEKPLAAAPSNEVTVLTDPIDLDLSSYFAHHGTKLPLAKGKRKREYARDDELELDLHLENIRRVRIQTFSLGITRKCRALFGYFEEDGRPEPAFCCGFRTNEDERCLIIEFEDSKSGALCDTINEQRFKQGGLFHTDLVKAELVEEDIEEYSLQITWMEEDEVQMYLKFHTAIDRDVIWNFITRAKEIWRIRNGLPPEPVSQESEVTGEDRFMAQMSYGSFDLTGADPWYPLFQVDDQEASVQSINMDEDSWSLYPPFSDQEPQTTYTYGSAWQQSISSDETPQPLFPVENVDTNAWYPLFPGNGPPPLETYSNPDPDRRESIAMLPNMENDAANTIELKRARNTQAARRSRRMKVRQFKELEGQVAKSQQDWVHSKTSFSSSQEAVPGNLEAVLVERVDTMGPILRQPHPYDKGFEGHSERQSEQNESSHEVQD